MYCTENSLPEDHIRLQRAVANQNGMFRDGNFPQLPQEYKEENAIEDEDNI